MNASFGFKGENEVVINGEKFACISRNIVNGYEWRKTDYLGEFPYNSYQWVVGTLGNYMFLKKFETEINPMGETDQECWFKTWSIAVSNRHACYAKIPESWTEYARTFAFKTYDKGWDLEAIEEQAELQEMYNAGVVPRSENDNPWLR